MLDAIASHLDAIAALAPIWGYVLIFLFMAVESSFIPFPSEVVMIPAGFLAARGELTLHSAPLDLTLACFVGLLGSLAGAFFNYWLSAKLGKPFLQKYGKWFFVKPEALDRACEVFNQYGAATTFACRLIPVIRQLISIPAGLARMPLAKFAVFTGLGAGIWTTIRGGHLLRGPRPPRQGHDQREPPLGDRRGDRLRRRLHRRLQARHASPRLTPRRPLMTPS